jgi:hypothetical protein
MSPNSHRRAGSADLPLHNGRVPAWLASRMAKLGAVMTEAIVHHYGREEFLRRLSNPFWFQSFGAVMGMDWHSSGITASVIGALKRMNGARRQARRYHWLGEGLESFVDTPHSAIEGPSQGNIINLADKRAAASRRKQLLLLSSMGPDKLARAYADVEGLPDPEPLAQLALPHLLILRITTCDLKTSSRVVFTVPWRRQPSEDQRIFLSYCSHRVWEPVRCAP